MFGRCRKCGRKLTDPISRERGFGPECWGEITSRAEALAASEEDEPLPGQINLFDYLKNDEEGDVERWRTDA